MELFRLFGSIFVNNSDAIDSIDQVDGAAENTGSNLGKMIGTAAKWGAGIAVGVGGAVVGLLGLASAASDTASEIADMSVRTGLSTTRLQELKFASEQSGVNFESLGGAVAKLTKNMGAADEGGKKATEAFEALGIETKDAATGGLKSMDDIFPQVLKKLGDITNETERNALATKFFGGTATEIIPLLEAGGAGIDAMSQQAHDLGLVLSEDSIAAGDTFGDSLDAIKSALGGVATKIGAELMPKFQVVFDWVLEHMPEIQATIGGAFDVAGVAIKGTIDVIQALTGFFTDHWAVMEPILAGIAAGGLVFGIYTIAINAAAWATTAWTAITAAATTVGAAFGAVIAFITSPIGIIILAIALLVAGIILLYKNWDTVSAFLKTSWEAIQSLASTVFGAIGKFISDLWEGIKKTAETAWEGIKKFFSTIWDGIKFIFFNLTLAGILIKHWDDIKAKVSEVWEGVKKFLSDTWTNISSVATTAWDGIKGMFKTAWDGIVGVIRGPANLIIGFANGIIGAYEKMLNAVAGVINKIPDIDIPGWVPVFGGKSFGIPDIGEISLPKIPMLAKGTDYFAGGLALVGEQGPELVNMPRGSSVTPNGRTEDLLGDKETHIHTHIHLDGKELTEVVSVRQEGSKRKRGRGLGFA